MKKKLLTVLLAVVMVFGVFGLTACGAGTNPDEEYNYYGTKYSLEGDVKIEAATFQGVYKMFTTAGNFLLYIDSEDGTGAASRFQAINTLAQEWDVTIYHFNPDLSGGYSDEGDVSANIITTLPASVDEGGIAVVQDTLSAIAKTDATKIKDHSLLAIEGAESTASSTGELVYNGSIASMVDYSKGAEAIASIATRKASYAQYGDPKNPVPEMYNTGNINTMNLFADSRLSIYTDDGTSPFTAEKTDVFVTVANYGQFAHLMSKNDGYFAVFFGGTWCGNTQAILKLTDELAKDYGITKIYFFDPRFDDGTMVDGVSEVENEDGTTSYAVVENSAYLARILNTRDTDGDAKWANLKASGQLTQYISMAETVLGTATVANEGFADDIKYDENAIQKIEDDAVYAEAQAEISDYADRLAEIKKEYTEDAWNKLFTEYDAENEAGLTEEQVESANKRIEAELVITNYNADEETEETIDVNAVVYDALIAQINTDKATIEGYAEMADANAIKAAVEARAKEYYIDTNFNYGHLYKAFLDEYLPDYESEWNYGTKLTIEGEEITKMCVPNIMMFNGEGEGAAKLVALAEAEYSWSNTSVEGTSENIEWTNAVKAVFDQNPYAYYAPLPDAEEATEEETASDSGSSTSSGTTSGSTGGAAAGGC